jgi:hypothetical protein
LIEQKDEELIDKTVESTKWIIVQITELQS